MRRTVLVSIGTSAVLAAGCVGGDSISPPRAADVSESGAAGDPRDAPTTCGRAPMGAWSGASMMKDGNSESWSVTRADVSWVLESSEGCVDRYRPSGTVSFAFRELCNNTIEPSRVAVAPTDGLLIVDRTRESITYELRGATTWQASITCAGQPSEPPFTVGGPWALARGTFDGDVMSGSSTHDDVADAWTFQRTIDYAASLTRRPPAEVVSSLAP